MDNKIEPVILSEDALTELTRTLDPDASLVHFKLVGIGPEAHMQVTGGPKVAKRLMTQQPNHYLYASKGDLRRALHRIVDVFCDRQGV